MRLFRKIPITISPFFWVTAALIGWMARGLFPHLSLLIAIFIWVGIIFVSILVHELGHALAALLFGQTPRIELVAFGGLTYPEGKAISKGREFLVVLNGPFFGFLLFLVSFVLLSFIQAQAVTLYSIFRAFMVINFYWTAINLVPILPLDGGQLVRIAFEGLFKAKGIKYAHLLSLCLSFFLCLASFFVGFFILGIFFSIFAFQNFDAWRKLRGITENDRDRGLKEELQKVEELLVSEPTTEVIPRLESIRARAKRGVIFNLTTQYLASVKAGQKRYREVYELLAPIRESLSSEAKVQLHSAAYAVADYPLVAKLAAVSFRLLPDPLIALHSAEAYASLKEVEPTIGWLKAAHQNGVSNLEEVIERSAFDSIRSDPTFKLFLRSLNGRSEPL